MNNGEKKELNNSAQMGRKLSQERMKKLLAISDKVNEISKTATGEIIEQYKKLDETIGKLIIEEAKTQESILSNVQQ